MCRTAGGVHTRSQSVGNLAAAAKAAPQPEYEPPRNLVQPYLKFEAQSLHFRPVYCEFRRFPSLNLEGQHGTSPFYSADSVKGGKGPAAAAAAEATVQAAAGGTGRAAASARAKGRQVENSQQQQQKGAGGKSATTRRLLRGEDSGAKQSKDSKK